MNFNELLNSYNLKKKIIVYVKDEGANLNAMTMVLKIVVSCDVLELKENFNGTCVGGVFSKTCQYVTTEEKICKNLKFVFIKSMNFDIQKCITWPKFFRKGRQEWSKACIDVKIRPRKLNTPIKTK
jgi:hypothetical protein